MSDVLIVDCSTGEQDTRPLTAAEQAQRDADAAAAAEAEANRPPTVQEQINEIRGRLDKAAAVPVTAGTDAAKVRDGLKPDPQ